MNEQKDIVSAWLETGSINIFGLPFAGKDTQGQVFADMFDGEVVSSGDILRHSQDNEELQRIMAAGEIIPSELFEEVVLPYLSNAKYEGKPLILSEVGRMDGEQQVITRATENSGHPQKAVVLLKLSDEEVYERFEAAKQIQDRGKRADDSREVLQTRLDAYHQKVTPVIEWYRDRGLLIEVDGSKSRDEVTNEIFEELLKRANN